MASKKSKVRKPLQGVHLYNKILHELTKINELLPVSKKLTIGKRRQLVSEVLYPSYKHLPQKQRTIKNIRSDIQSQINELPPEQTCHPLYFPDNQLALIDYFEIDNFIKTYLPDCIDIRVNAAEFGITAIFNTMKYSYYSSGVRDIVENIREEIAKSNSGVAFFEGVKKIKPNKPDDLQPEHYFIDFVLIINDILVDDEAGVDYKLPSGSKKVQKKILRDVEKRMKNLQREKSKKKRHQEKEKQKVKLRNDVRKAKKKSTTLKRQDSVAKAVDIALKALLSAYRKKAITKNQYDREKQKLMKLKK